MIVPITAIVVTSHRRHASANAEYTAADWMVIGLMVACIIGALVALVAAIRIEAKK